MKIKFFLVLSCFLLLISCDKKRVFDDYKSVGNEWNKDSIVRFDLPEMNPKEKYNLFLNLRNNNDYPFDNIFLIVSLEAPDKSIRVDTLEYQMADPDGNLLGEGFSDIKESKLIYKENETFKAGKYKVSIKHAARQTGKVVGLEKLNGVTEVGFRVESLQ